MHSCNTRFLALPLLALLAGCTSVSPPHHESQLAPGVNLAGYSTFGWSPPSGAATADSPMRLLDVNIRNALRTEFSRRGYEEVEANPGLRIDYEIVAEDKIKASPFRVGIGLGSWGSNVGGSVNVGSPSTQNYREGRLVVHVVDAAKNQEVWLGTFTGEVDRQHLDADAVARVVALAMEDFPLRPAAP